MKTIQVQGVSKPVSKLVMGSDYFRPENIEQVSEILDGFLAIGGNTIDTAFVYQKGNSEQAIGLWLQGKNRDTINIWTKGAHHNADGPRVNKDAISEELDISLERLQTDHVELYALHRDNPDVAVGAILEWLNEHVESGKMGAFGASNWTTSRLQEANDYAAEHGLRGFSFNSPNLSLAKAIEPYWPGCVSADSQMVAWHERTQLPLMSWSSQARGFFTGRFTREDTTNADLVRVFYNDENWERYRRAQVLAEEKGVSTIQIALAYVLNQSFPTCAIVGPQNSVEMTSCKEAAKLELTRDELNWLDLASSTR